MTDFARPARVNFADHPENSTKPGDEPRMSGDTWRDTCVVAGSICLFTGLFALVQWSNLSITKALSSVVKML